MPAAWPGGNRAGPGHGALLRRRDHPQLHRPARLRPHLSGRHSGSGRPRATGKTDAVRLLNAIEVPWQPASPPELTIGPGICKPPVPPAAPSPPRRQGEGPGRVGPWSVARAPVVGWTGCYERAPGRRGVTGPGPRTAQSRSARRGGGASRLCPARAGSQRAAQVDDAVGDRGGVLPGHGARSRLPDGVAEDGHLLDDRVNTGAPGSGKPASSAVEGMRLV
jgi:hypothetical protein